MAAGTLCPHVARGWGQGWGQGWDQGVWAQTDTVGPALALQKVMHTRKRHSELYHELNQKFHTLDRYRAPAAGTSKVRSWGGGGVASCPASPFA